MPAPKGGLPDEKLLKMKSLLASAVLFLSFSAQAQYYYKDIVGNRETEQLMKAYLSNKVSRVVLNSFDENNLRITDFLVEQQFSPVNGTLKTTTRSGTGPESVMTTFLNAAGQVTRTVDSSSIIVTRTSYSYDATGRLVSSLSSSSDSSGKTSQQEEHLWQYDGDRIARLLRIKNKKDTTVVEFKYDDQGNIIEEQETRLGVKNEPVYYYYNDNNKLTDIVRYSKKAKRLLPEYLFEYSPTGQVIQKITVPTGSDRYLIWRYQYNQQGLKSKEAVYNKQKQLTGKIEYQYFY